MISQFLSTQFLSITVPQYHGVAGERAGDIDRRPCGSFAAGPGAWTVGDGVRSNFGRTRLQLEYLLNIGETLMKNGITQIVRSE